MEDTALAAAMFGGFSMQMNGKPLMLWQNRGSRVVGLLQFLIFYQGKSFHKEELYDMLYSDDECGDPSNTFRVTLHRLRKLLVSSGLPDETYITSKNGMCGWNGEIPVDTDVRRFEALLDEAAAAAAAGDAETALNHRLDALELYKGELLPNFLAEDWVAVESARLKNLYLGCIEDAAAALRTAGDLEKIYAISTTASAIYPYDESLHLMRIAALIDLRRPREALAAFESVTDTYYTQLGLKPSDQMIALHARIAEQIPDHDVSIDSVKKLLDEEGETRGAFFCDYLTFTESYRYVIRIVERSGQSVYLMLCTLTDLSGRPLEEGEKLRAASDAASASLKGALRRGDMYTCLAPGQFLVLLIGINQENCSIVSTRVERIFRENCRPRGVRMRFKMISASGPSEGKTVGAVRW